MTHSTTRKCKCFINIIFVLILVEEEESPVEHEARAKQDLQLSEQFVDIFLKESENVSLVLGLLEVS